MCLETFLTPPPALQLQVCTITSWFIWIWTQVLLLEGKVFPTEIISSPAPQFQHRITATILAVLASHGSLLFRLIPSVCGVLALFLSFPCLLWTWSPYCVCFRSIVTFFAMDMWSPQTSPGPCYWNYPSFHGPGKYSSHILGLTLDLILFKKKKKGLFIVTSQNFWLNWTCSGFWGALFSTRGLGILHDTSFQIQTSSFVFYHESRRFVPRCSEKKLSWVFRNGSISWPSFSSPIYLTWLVPPLFFSIYILD